MLKQVRWVKYARPILVLSVCFSVVITAGQVWSATKKRADRKRPITKPKFDPSAERVELFEGIEKGLFKVRVLPKDSKKGKLLIENMTDKPLTVELPESFVAQQQTLKQPQGQGGGGGGTGGGFGGGGQGGGGFGGRGGGQGFGGGGRGGGGFGGGGGGFGGGGGGFFSIPAEKVVAMPYRSVCLEHGKKEPNIRMTYGLVRTEEYTKDERLVELLSLVASRNIDSKIAQAAAWHITDKMSWDQLANKQVKHLVGRPTPYFHPRQLQAAQQLLALAKSRAEERKKSQKDKKKKDEKKSVRDFDTKIPTKIK